MHSAVQQSCEEFDMNILTNSGKVENNCSTMSQLFETVTTQSLDQHMTFQNLFDVINSDDKGPEEAVQCFVKRLEPGDSSVIRTTLLLLDSCVQNCGNRFRRLVFSRDFLQKFVRIIEQNNDSTKEVQTIALSLIQKWTTNYQEVPELEDIRKQYENRINRNVDFSAKGSERPSKNAKPSIEIVFDKENDDPTEATPIGLHPAGRQNHRSQSPSSSLHNNQKNSPRPGEHRRSRCLSPKTRRGSRQLDSVSASAAKETRSRSPSPPADDRRDSGGGGQHGELLDLRSTLSAHLVLGERRRSRCLSPMTRRGSRPLFLDSTVTTETETERWPRRFSSQLAKAASISPTRADARRSQSSSIVHRNNNNNNNNNNNDDDDGNEALESDVKYELKAFRQKYNFFADLISVLTPGNETYFDGDHLEELSLNLTKIKNEVVRLMESPEGNGFQDELRILHDDIDKVLLRYKDFCRSTMEKGDKSATSKTSRGSLTIRESDEVFSEQTDLDSSEYESPETVDKQLSDQHVSTAKDVYIAD